MFLGDAEVLEADRRAKDDSGAINYAVIQMVDSRKRPRIITLIAGTICRRLFRHVFRWGHVAGRSFGDGRMGAAGTSSQLNVRR